MIEPIKKALMDRVDDLAKVNAAVDRGSRADAMLNDELLRGWVFARVSAIVDEIVRCDDGELPTHRATLRAVLALWTDLCQAVTQGQTASMRLATNQQKEK